MTFNSDRQKLHFPQEKQGQASQEKKGRLNTKEVTSSINLHKSLTWSDHKTLAHFYNHKDEAGNHRIKSPGTQDTLQTQVNFKNNSNFKQHHTTLKCEMQINTEASSPNQPVIHLECTTIHNRDVRQPRRVLIGSRMEAASTYVHCLYTSHHKADCPLFQNRTTTFNTDIAACFPKIKHRFEIGDTLIKLPRVEMGAPVNNLVELDNDERESNLVEPQRMNAMQDMIEYQHHAFLGTWRKRQFIVEYRMLLFVCSNIIYL
ncbi:hypothetical protein PR048_020199 [Dryococelus australis]|uniref:Uncharacterized protein n=1 Tax=Dryococelus australis TaxID=614101 RepID=A0ABQ9H5V0_9NEOP|nr:hypothetical protein PR048_020199 [Dryococelus australis]